MDQEKKSGIYMSSYLCEFNRIFKEFNDIYHEVASRLGLSNSAFDIFMRFANWEMDVYSVIFVRQHIFRNRQ